MENKNKDKLVPKKITRRQFIKKTGLAAGAAAAAVSGVSVSPRRASAAKRDYILVGRPNPSTGPVSSFGESSPWTDERALAEINRDGGIFIKEAGKKLPVKMKMVDTESDPTKAAEVASRLIMNEKIDLMLAMHTPATVNPVSAVCERFEVPCISLESPMENWLEGGPYKWCFHSFWLTEKDFLPVYVGMWDQLKTNKKVGFVMNNDPDGISFTKIFGAKLPELGYEVVDLGVFPYGLQDFSNLITAWKKEKVDILIGNVIPPDWASCWRQCRQQGFIPKIATIGRAILFPSAVGALGGDLPNNLACEIWWSPNHPFKSSLAGYSSKELCDAWTAETGKQWTQPIGFKYAGWEIVADVLKRTDSLDKKAIRKSIAETDLATMVGHIKYNSQHYCRTPLVGGQWVKGTKFPWELKIVYNEHHPDIALTGKLTPMS